LPEFEKPALNLSMNQPVDKPLTHFPVMKYVLALLFAVIVLPLNAGTPDTLRVTTHNRVLVTTDPSQGVKHFPARGIFPDAKTDIRRITMTVTLGCPDSMPCAHWDYLDHIYVRHTGGNNCEPGDYELGRMLTPYGSIFSSNWQYSWTVDVTDFSMLLRGDVEIDYVHSGYEPTDVGWALTIRFDIITGTPVAEPVTITRLWQGDYPYGDPKESIENKLTPIEFKTRGRASTGRVRIQHTGHGMDEPRGCSEFCSRYRDIKFNGRVVDRRNIWKKCGDNPLYPQGGTWIYDRGYWCPGNLQPADIIDVKLKPGNQTIDIDMEPYRATGKVDAHENISSCLIQYRSPTNANDAAIDNIITPSGSAEFSRINPVCCEPRIIIRNMGSKNLTSAVISYGTIGYKARTYTWHGNLRFNETALVNLRGPVDYGNGNNTFFAMVSLPNGTKDEWVYDNRLTAEFPSPLILPAEVVIQFHTNNHPADNKLFIMNAFGGIVFNRENTSFKANTTYYDTIRFDPGCYELFLQDSTGDGLEFWFEPEQGRGYLRLLDVKGNLLYNFESDCGNGQHLAFTASPDYVADTTITKFAFGAYPLMVKNKLTVDCLASKPSDIHVLIRGAENQLLEDHLFLNLRNRETSIDVSHLPSGRYFLEIQVNGERQYKKRFNKE